MEKWKQHLGVYGIHIKDEKLLVVKKTRGPYIYRFDLPGGSFDPNESTFNCLRRELNEEIGYDFNISKNIGTFDYLVPWPSENGSTHVHHIAIFYDVEPIEDIVCKPQIADDTEGYDFVSIDSLSINNSSPLVIDVVNYYMKMEKNQDMKRFDNWEILKQSYD